MSCESVAVQCGRSRSSVVNRNPEGAEYHKPCTTHDHYDGDYLSHLAFFCEKRTFEVGAKSLK